jgi:undecaprenyl-diphosphatase
MAVRATLQGLIEQARRVGRQELSAVLLVLLVAGGVWAFVEIADEVHEGEADRFDTAVMRAMRSGDDLGDPIGPAWVEEAARDVTALGSFTVLGLVTLVTAGALWLQGNRRTAAVTVVAILGAAGLNQALKTLFGRARPDLVPPAVEVASASFPSAHAMLSAVVYLTLGTLVAQVQVRRRVKGFVIACAVLLALLVGASRVYLGVHYPTDVLAGWAVGAAWARLGWAAAVWYRRRTGRAPEPDTRPG